ncbi:MAG: hypothetical protein MUF72_04835 [Elainella sp. Prado103]|nr:hypothetical protein [Elainella sp. Prado103]
MDWQTLKYQTWPDQAWPDQAWPDQALLDQALPDQALKHQLIGASNERPNLRLSSVRRQSSRFGLNLASAALVGSEIGYT